jgi:TRAP-type C4-dicarboxylate transport system substrate-binding protein
MTKKTTILILILVCLFSASLFGRPITIKVASLAPKGSPWDSALRKIASDWSDISNGDIQMKIYPGGIAGDEDDILRKMRFNQLQGAVLTSMGLNTIAPDTLALSIPFLITSNPEFEYVFEKISPFLSKGIEESGYKVLGWTQAGWIHIFSTKKIVYPDDLKRLKSAGYDIDTAMFQAWKEMGYEVIPLSLGEVATALSSGMVDACYMVLIGIVAYQLYNVIDYMMDFPISPVIGGFIVTNRTWNSIDDSIKPQLLSSAQAAADQLYRETQKLEEEALDVLQEQGTERVTLSEDAKEQWREEFQEGFGLIAGKSFSMKIYELIKKYVEEYRK